MIAVKKISETYDLQPQGKDSQHFLQAGADEVFLLSQHQMLQMVALAEGEDPWRRLHSALQENDLVLMEGVSQPHLPIIEVFNSTLGQPLKFPAERLAAVVGDRPPPGVRIPFFPMDNIEGIGQFMEEYHGQQD